MSVLIKGMKMPQPGIYDGRLTVTLSGDALFYLFHECGAHPAKEIPPHGRLIDADALEDDVLHLKSDAIRAMNWTGDKSNTWNERINERSRFFVMINEAPTIIEAEEGEG